MEIFGAIFDEEYESLSKMFDNPDHFLLHENSIFPSDHTFNNNYFNCISQESSNSTEIDTAALFTINDHGNENDKQPNHGTVNSLHDHVTNDNSLESVNFYDIDCHNDGFVVPFFPDNVMEEILNLKAEMFCNEQNVVSENENSCKEMQLKRKGQEIQSEDYSSEGPKKKPRVSRNKNKRVVVQTSKNKKNVIHDDNINEEGINNGIGNRVESLLSSSSSEDDHFSNGSKELINGGSTSGSKGSTCLNSDGKARAGRGSATDPQSLYARRRRERISERLRILQNLVPNGTKVDISTMLEEAVHYVKFLQLQIKLLSSDDLWMYAPIAYNGMDLGMYHKISPNLWPLN